MYDYKTLLMAFLFVKLEGFELKFDSLVFSKELKLEDILYDEKQIKFNERMMKTSLVAMKIEQDQSLQYCNQVIDTLINEGFEETKEVLSFLLD